MREKDKEKKSLYFILKVLSNIKFERFILFIYLYFFLIVFKKEDNVIIKIYNYIEKLHIISSLYLHI